MADRPDSGNGPMMKQTAESSPPSISGDTFKTLPNKDSRVLRSGWESGDGKVQGQEKR